MGTAIKHPVPDWVKPSFEIFDIRALRHPALSIRVPRCQKLQMTAQDALQLYLYGNNGCQRYLSLHRSTYADHFISAASSKPSLSGVPIYAERRAVVSWEPLKSPAGRTHVPQLYNTAQCWHLVNDNTLQRDYFLLNLCQCSDNVITLINITQSNDKNAHTFNHGHCIDETGSVEVTHDLTRPRSQWLNWLT